MEATSFVANLIKNISVDDHRELELEAKRYSLDEWINWHKTKVGGIGAVTSIIPIIGEGIDITYLGRTIGRLCFGIGHNKNKSLCYDSDIEGILAIWTNVATPISKKELKREFKEKFYSEINETYQKYLEEYNNKNTNNSILKKLLNIIFSFFKKGPLSLEKFEENLFKNYLNEIRLKNKLIIDHHNNDTVSKFIREAIFSFRLIKNITNKSLSKKIGFKLGTKIGLKIGPKIISKASSKLGAKIMGKFSTKYIPFIGMGTSAAINVWIVEEISKAAISYYDADYIKLKSDIFKDIIEDTSINTIINNIL